MSMRRTGIAALTAVLAGLAAPGPAHALTPSISERPLASAVQPYGVEAGADGALWFAESAASRIGRMTTSGAVAEVPLPSGSTTQWDLTAGPDGNMWLAEDAGNRIARVTPTGAITEFLVPTASSSPTGIITGPDGNVWFTEAAAGKIGRVTPTGVITEFPLPTTTGQPRAIAAGADGNLWIVESSANRVARISTTGVVTEFPVPTPSAGLYDIAAGPDDNLWFAERTAGRIGRITTAGVVTEFPLPSPGSQPLALAAGPDAALWFTEVSGNAIGRITMTGAVSEYPVPTVNASLASIGRGPDGNMWFSEAAANKIARITTPPAVDSGTPGAPAETAVKIAVGVDAHAQWTLAHVEYGATSTYGSATADQLTTTNGQTVSATLAGLTPATTYHFRTVASNGTGTSYGPDQTFTTATPATDVPFTPLPATGDAAVPLDAPPSADVLPATDATPGAGDGPAVRAAGEGAAVKHAAPLPVKVSDAPVVVSHGAAPIALTCPATAKEGCRGRVVLRLAPKRRSKKAAAKGRASAARCARGCRPLGQATFEANGGKTKTVKVRLSASARTMLARSGKLEATASVSVTAYGKTVTTSKKVELRARA